MFIDLLILTALCFFQSVFGIGILLFGTPIFIILGYDYYVALLIIFPFSITISILQIIFSKNKNYEFVIKLSFYTLPFFFISLLILNKFKEIININILVAVILIVFSLANLLKNKYQIFKIKKIKLNLALLGIIHGFTNLGGSLLTILITNLKDNKVAIRFDLALSYLILSSIQLINVIFRTDEYFFNYIYFIWIPLLTYLLSQKTYSQIKNNNFIVILNLSALILGLYIFIANF